MKNNEMILNKMLHVQTMHYTLNKVNNMETFAPMAAISRIDRGRGNVHLKISFWRFFRLTFPCNDPLNTKTVEMLKAIHD